MNNNPKPLDGITVVSLEHAIAAPFCTRQLADLGAKVIKIERPNVGDFARAYDHRVDGLASHFVWANRSKQSLTLNLKHSEAKPILNALLAQADVFVQNLAPRAAARLGLSFEQLHKNYPKLIVCDISGYGIGGPYEQKKAYDLLIQSESGFLSTTGHAEAGGEAKAGISIADICAGMYGYSSILSALLLREKTGKGSHIDVSMLESMVEWMSYPLYYAYHQAPPPPRAGASHATIYPYGAFSTADGQVLLGLQNEREWQKFCEIVLDLPGLAEDDRFLDNSRRSANREALKAIIDSVFSQLSQQTVQQRLEAAEIANAKINDMHAVWQHPQLTARKRWKTIDSPIGKLPALLPPAGNSDFDCVMGAVPDLGEHNTPILGELGYSEQAIAQLQEKGVI